MKIELFRVVECEINAVYLSIFHISVLNEYACAPPCFQWQQPFIGNGRGNGIGNLSGNWTIYNRPS
jgi:hypothetical protein